MDTSLLINIVYGVVFFFIVLFIFFLIYLFMIMRKCIGIIDTIFKKAPEKESNNLNSPAFLLDLCLTGLGLFGFIGSTWRKRLLLIMVPLITWILHYFYHGYIRTAPGNQPVGTSVPKSNPRVNKSVILPQTNNPKLQNDASSKVVIKTRDMPREYLCDLIRSYGRKILEDPRKVNALLMDYYKGKFIKERNSLVNALNEGIPQDLIRSENIVPKTILFYRCKKRLMDNYGVNEKLVIWTIDSWAIALGTTNFSHD
jgi:hypothetical protein